MARRSNARQYEVGSFSMSLDGDIQGQLNKFFGDIADKCYRPATYVASTVLYDEIKLRVPKDTGGLENAIYRYREKSDTHINNLNKSTFYVGVNKRKAPHWWLIEHGHWQRRQAILLNGKWVTLKNPLANPKYVPAQPYFRPAIDAKMNEALQAGLIEFKKRFESK